MDGGVRDLSYPMRWGWLDAEDVAAVLRNRPEDVSDTVTGMMPVKHAFQQGIRARRGIDY